MGADIPENLLVVELHGESYDVSRAPLAESMHSFFNVPLIVKGNIAGCLYVASRQENAFDEFDVRNLYAVANQAATAMERLQALLQQERAHLEAIVEGLGEGIALLDSQRRIYLSNPAGNMALSLLNTAPLNSDDALDSIAEIHLAEINLQIEKNTDGVARFTQTSESGDMIFAIRARYVQVHNEPMLLIIFQDITEQHHHEQQLESLSMTDPLTGLGNRRKLFDSLEREIARSRRYGDPIALIMLDLDHFKQINDTFGHKAGDRALQNVGATLKRMTRITDQPTRYGGDEFIISLPHTSLVKGKLLAERLLTAICQLETNGQLLKTSIGITELTSSDDVLGESFVERADQALYQAKQNGGGCICVISSGGI